MNEAIIMFAQAGEWDLVSDELYSAYEKGNKKVCASIDNETGKTLLHLAVEYGDLEIIEELLYWFKLFSIKTKGEIVISNLLCLIDHRGRTPIEISSDNEITMFLQEIV